MRTLLLLLPGILLPACDDEGTPASPLDSSPPVDAAVDVGPLVDAFTPDDGVDPEDAGESDGGTPDLGAPDSGAFVVGAADLTAPVPAGEARAGRVDEEAERLTGPEAACRLGCYRLDNARASFCIQDEGTFSQFTFTGGNLVDAHLADRPGTDLFGQHLVTPGGGEVRADRVGIAADGSDGGAAVVRIEGRTQGMRLVQGVIAGGFVPMDLRAVTEYRLAPDTVDLEVVTTLTADRLPGSVLLGDVAYFGDRTTSLPLEGALAAYGRGAAYAWRHLDTPLREFSVDVLPLVFATHGQAFFQVGDSTVLRRTLRIGRDIEDVRDSPEGGRAVTLRGPDGALVQIDGAAGPVTQALLEGGARVVHLEDGDYRATVLGWPGGEVPPFELVVDGDAEVELAVPEPATLVVRVEDADGRLLGGRVEVAGVGTRLVVGEAALALPAGERALTVTRGWHYSAWEGPVALEAGEPVSLTVVLDELIPTPGWSSGEFHQHASPSVDSDVAVEHRVLDNGAAGVGFMVPSDHDVIYDYAALVERLGLGDHVTVPLTGVEISPVFTHLGAYGIPFDPRVGAGGAPPLPYWDEATRSWKVHTVVELVEEARRRGARVVQVNHPRGGESAFFDTVELDAQRPVAEVQSVHWTTGFDSVEVFNDEEYFCRVLADWLGLLNQGLRVTAVGNSDTHGDHGDGFPRNYVPTIAEHPTGVTADEIVSAVREGRTSIGGGAFLDLPDGPAFGDTVSTAGEWRVRVRVRTPPWTAMRRLVAFHNGRIAFDRALEAGPEAVVDLDEEIAVPVETDGYVVLVAVGDSRAAHGFDPVFALGNPVWVDADGDGRVDPPGALPVERLEVEWCEP